MIICCRELVLLLLLQLPQVPVHHLPLLPLLARLFGLVCPFVSNLAVYWQPLPMVVLGLPALAFGTLSLLFLPETFGRPLPQNIDEAMEINKSNVAMRRLKGKREKK